MPGILALDPSITCFGWAHAECGGPPTWGSGRIGPENASFEQIIDALDIFLKARVDVFHPEWIVKEQTYDGPNPMTNKKLHYMSCQIEVRAKDWGIGCRDAEPNAATKHFLSGQVPKGRAAKKRAVVARCHLLGWKVLNHNQADGCAILTFAEAKLFPEMRLKMLRPAGPLFMGNPA